MGVTARDIMDTHFHTIHPEASIVEAVEVFKKISEEEHQKIFGMIVADARGNLIGMIAMYDILLLMRPRQVPLWEEMSQDEIVGLIEESCRRAKSIKVSDIMTRNVVTISPETHLLAIIDKMLKKHIRRLPVLENGKIIGMVYISKVFYHLAEWLTCG